MKHLMTLLKVAISLGLLWYLSTIIDMQQTRQALLAGDGRWLGAALAVYLMTFAIVSWRWQTLFKAQGICLPLSDLIPIYLTGFFFNNFFPTSVGGDVVRIYQSAKLTGRPAVSFSTVFMERLVGSLAIVVMGLAGVLAAYSRLQNPLLPWTAGALLLVISGGIALCTRPRGTAFLQAMLDRVPISKIRELGRKVLDSFRVYQDQPGKLAYALALSILYQLLMCFFAYCVSLAIGLGMGLSGFLICVPVVATLGMLPSINGLGLRESGFVYMLTRLGRADGTTIAPAEALTFALLVLLANICISCVGGVVFAVRRQKQQTGPTD
jgi:uncharacterized membrane protein YbhN (UPF0104 family)